MAILQKLKTRLLALIERLCRPKYRGTLYNLYANFAHGKKVLLCNSFFVCSREGDGTTSPSCTSINWSIYASNSSLKVQMGCYFMQLVYKVGHFTHGKELFACDSFICL